MSDLNNILNSFETKFSQIKNKEDLQNLKSEFLEKMALFLFNLKKWVH